METTAVGYARVSTVEQAAEGVSLEAQEERIHAYCRLAGLDLREVIREEGVSGSLPIASRPGGKLLLAALGKGAGVRHVVALKLDRLFRNAIDALTAIEAWDRAGVGLHLVDLGGAAVSTVSPIGKFFLQIMAGLAELERNMIADRTRAALRHKRDRREAYGHCPLGFRRDGDKLVEVPEELELVRRIREEREAGRTLADIAASLNRERIPTKRGEGRRWHPSTVHYVLRNALHTPQASGAGASVGLGSGSAGAGAGAGPRAAAGGKVDKARAASKA